MTLSIPGYIALLRSHGHTQRAIARAAGLSDGMVWGWIHGESTPTLEVAALVEEAFGTAGFVAAVRAKREGICANCGSTFLAAKNSTGRALYCSKPCMDRVRNERHRSRFREMDNHKLRNDLARVRLELQVYKDCTEADCFDCEPLGVCHDADCWKRPVSPLPLADARLRIA